MGSESTAHEAECAIDLKGERNNCFGKIQLVGKRYIEAKQL